MELSIRHGDFDGDGLQDTLYVWKDGSDWIAHIETDAGFGAQTVLPTDQSTTPGPSAATTSTATGSTRPS